MRGSLCRPNMSFIWLFRISPSLSFFFFSSLVPFCLSVKKKRSAECSALQDPCSVNTARPEEAWEPMSLKSVTMWTIRTKDGRKVKWYIRGNVCQVQSAWKLSVPWRADESQGPNRRVQIYYVQKWVSVKTTSVPGNILYIRGHQLYLSEDQEFSQQSPWGATYK